MWYELYTREKLRELEQERLARRSRHPRLPRPARRRLAGPLLRRAGGTLRRLGENLESWGASPPRSTADREPA